MYVTILFFFRSLRTTICRLETFNYRISNEMAHVFLDAKVKFL